jgi:hypothetical protein
MAEPFPAEDGLRQRQKSVAAIELVDDHGRRKTVHLDDMTEADRALAEQFGYKPVSICPMFARPVRAVF